MTLEELAKSLPNGVYDSDVVVPGRGALPKQAFVSRFFVNQWNAFIHVAALDASLQWK